MKVLYLTPGCFDKGGISRYNRFQVRALREMSPGADVRVYSLSPKGADDLEEPFDVAWSPTRKAHTLNQLGFAATACAHTLTWQPDIVWIAHVNMSGFGVALAKTVRARSVLNTYGLEVWSGLTRARAFGLRHVDAVISDCHFTARYLETSGYRAPGSVSVIRDTVDTTRFTPGEPDPAVVERYGIPDPRTAINVMTLGRMTPDAEYKGYSRLLEAFASSARDVPNLNLVYAGQGGLIDVLRRRASELGLGDRVHFAGSVHDADLAQVYRCGHIFALISDRGSGKGEGVPVTPLEAAACGIPIIVGNQDGSPEAVAGEENGYVLDSLDIEAHSRTITRLAMSPELRARMGAAGRRRIEDEFSYPIFRQCHHNFLKNL